ncbi:conserved hypothetical protein [Gammaproteobacteria bacterium]
MKGISDIKIIGVDEKRPPIIRKEPYIDLYLRLSHEAPSDWCEQFNKLAQRMVPQVKIDGKGIFIETYVREMNQVVDHFESIKKIVLACNNQYIELIQQMQVAADKKNSDLQGEGGQQGKLNAIIANLKFDD